jgi:hypothetical protein
MSQLPTGNVLSREFNRNCLTTGSAGKSSFRCDFELNVKKLLAPGFDLSENPSFLPHRKGDPTVARLQHQKSLTR